LAGGFWKFRNKGLHFGTLHAMIRLDVREPETGPGRPVFYFQRVYSHSMKKFSYKVAFLALAGALGVSAQSASPRQVKVAIDPRSEGEAEGYLLKSFGKLCPNISVVRDESEAEYVLLASDSDPQRGLLLHYYIAVYDKQGKVVFATDKHSDKNATKAVCRFINGQK
jgi:hypothetical protein